MIITFANQKGGVGKSSMIFTLAHILANNGERKVLCLDLCGNTSLTHTFEKNTLLSKDAYIGTIIDVLDGNCSLSDATYTYRHIDFVPGVRDINLKQGYYNHDAGLFLNRFKPRLDLYDFVFIDTDRDPSSFLTMALAISDHAIIPTDASSKSIEAIIDTIAIINQCNQLYNTNCRVLSIPFFAYTECKCHKLVSSEITNISRLANCTYPSFTKIATSSAATEFLMRDLPATRSKFKRTKCNADYHVLADNLTHLAY